MESIPHENLATVRKRFAALCIDLGSMLFLAAAPVAWVSLAAITQLGDPPGASDSIVFALLGVSIACAILGTASFVWFLMVSSRGMTPGKQLMSLHVVKPDDRSLARGEMLLREALAKAPFLLMLGSFSAVVGIVSFLPLIGLFSQLLRTELVQALLLIAFLVDNCWAFRNAGRQTIHDRVMNTFVVKGRG